MPAKQLPPDLSNLFDSLPLIIPRCRIEEYLPGLISRRYLANLDSAGLGPKKVRIGAKVGYLRSDLIVWLCQRITPDV